MRTVPITTAEIHLDAFLKWAGVADTGGEAKVLIQQGGVRVNGAAEGRRSRKLRPGDVVTVRGRGEFLVSR